ncbi:uncharacterized protein LOC107224312 [Neodiprion lecontei]|uniref:Uncharacterized protein LOC107224312 n=1 Tax=Neodiprion lecontei TaxID=441921 RepID=A0ABM3G0M4_NEOLC|nr:uncharacterized protein LOC107224312 [Neodiprion lecontei]
MNKIARLIFRVCVTAGNLRISLPNTTRFFYTPNTSFSYASYSKDYRSNREPSIRGSESDVVLQALATVRTKDEIFEIVTTYRPLLKIEHSLAAFKILDTMHRQKSNADLTIVEKAEFLELCKVLLNDINSLDGNEAVYILKTLTYLGVSNTSLISQSLLQVIRQSLNNLSFRRLLELEYQLEHFKSSPLSDALKIAVPALCEIQLQNNMLDKENIGKLMSALVFLRNKSGHHELIANVVDSIRKIGQDMKVSYASKIFKYMCDLQYLPPGYEEVVRNVQQILIRYMNFVSIHDIELILGKMYKQMVFFENKTFYNEELVDACARACIARNIEFEKGVTILKVLSNIGHTQIRLIDYVAAECYQNPVVLSKCSEINIRVLVIALATADYKPIFWETMQEIISKIVDKDQFTSSALLLDFAVSMAVLDCYNPRVIKEIFSENFLSTEMLKNETQTSWNFLLLYQSIQTLCSTPVGKSPPERLLETAICYNTASVKNSSLLPALEQAMGGSQFVTSNLRTRLGHYIDHVIMVKDGHPLALNFLQEAQEYKLVTHIEEIVPPAESQVIMVINLPDHAYAINSRRLKGPWSLMLKTLEKHTGHAVIPISSLMWNDLMDYEKIPYLMQAIRLKCDKVSTSTNV